MRLRRCIAGALAWMIAFLVPGALAAEEVGFVRVNQLENFRGIRSGCVVDGSFYALEQGGLNRLLVHPIPGGSPRVYDLKGAERLESTKDASYTKLWLLNRSGALTMLANTYIYANGGFECDSALYAVEEEGDGYRLVETGKPDWSGIGDAVSEITAALSLETGVLMLGYDQDGTTCVLRLDYETGLVQHVEGLTEIYGMVPFKAGKALLLQFREAEKSLSFIAVDGECDAREVLLERSGGLWWYVRTGLAYDWETDVFYYTMNGQIYPIDLAQGEIGRPAADLQTGIYNGSGWYADGGYYLAAAGQAYAIYDLRGNR